MKIHKFITDSDHGMHCGLFLTEAEVEAAMRDYMLGHKADIPEDAGLEAMGEYYSKFGLGDNYMNWDSDWVDVPDAQNESDHVNINHFLTLAMLGTSAGSSTGEKRAHRLAWLMRQAIEECAGIDIAGAKGATLLMEYANSGGDGFCMVRDLLQERGFTL